MYRDYVTIKILILEDERKLDILREIKGGPNESHHTVSCDSSEKIPPFNRKKPWARAWS